MASPNLRRRSCNFLALSMQELLRRGRWVLFGAVVGRDRVPALLGFSEFLGDPKLEECEGRNVGIQGLLRSRVCEVSQLSRCRGCPRVP